jgi:single-stranded DNA-binding protein
MMHAFISGELIRDTAFDSGLVERLMELRKGDPLSVSGRLQVSAYLDKQGGPRGSASRSTS